MFSPIPAHTYPLQVRHRIASKRNHQLRPEPGLTKGLKIRYGSSVCATVAWGRLGRESRSGCRHSKGAGGSTSSNGGTVNGEDYNIAFERLLSKDLNERNAASREVTRLLQSVDDRERDIGIDCLSQVTCVIVCRIAKRVEPDRQTQSRWLQHRSDVLEDLARGDPGPDAEFSRRL